MGEKYFPQPSVMTAQQHFAAVPSAEIQRSKFDRSHAYKTTFDAGQLIPVFVDEILPGDTFSMNATAFARLATPLKPIMDNIYLDTHFFFVPYRLVWDNWQEFCGERKNPDDDPTVFTVPKTLLDLQDVVHDDLAAYFGIPRTAGSTAYGVSELPFRAYALIWNEWFRDQNLQDRIPFNTSSVPTNWDNFKPLRRGKRHDYFTSCLPWPQKGDPVTIPLGQTAPVLGIGKQTGTFGSGGTIRESDGTDTAYTALAQLNTATVDNNFYVAQSTEFPGYPGIYADLTNATAVSINDLRTAFQIQKLLERDARGGTRYIELILSHFGVRSDDARLQRPEYLGGNSQRININPIASTFRNTEVPQADLAAIGTGINKANWQKSFTEHGIIIGLVSARADLTYQNGIDRFWTRSTRYDFYWPALAHLGEQAVLNREIYVTGTATDVEVFGYQERYAEYRYKPSKITGRFSSEDPNSLDVWHLAQDFTATPALNASFIEDNPPIDRIIAVQTEPHFLLDMWFNLTCQRPMPVYSVPGLVDHF